MVCFHVGMRITSPTNYQANKVQTPQFKASIPVVVWVAEANGSYAPIANLGLVKKLQSKLVRVLNKPLAETKKTMDVAQQKLRAYFGACDIDYRNLPIVRSFYNRVQGSVNKYSPVSYIISGKDVGLFEELHAKEIGKQKSAAQELLATSYSPEAVEAIKSYNECGLDFVNESARKIKDRNKQTQVLHVKFEIVRNKSGEIKDYRYIDSRFLPEFGPESPFERLKG